MTRLLLWLERRHYRACAKARDKYRPPFTSPAVTTHRQPNPTEGDAR